MLATAQVGVVSPAQLGACGFSAKAVRRRINEGTWHRVGGAIVLAPGHSGAAGWNDASLSWILRLTCGAQTRISGALTLRRARWHLPHETQVVVVKDKPNFGLPGVTVLRRPDTLAEDLTAPVAGAGSMPRGCGSSSPERHPDQGRRPSSE